MNIEAMPITRGRTPVLVVILAWVYCLGPGVAHYLSSQHSSAELPARTGDLAIAIPMGSLVVLGGLLLQRVAPWPRRLGSLLLASSLPTYVLVEGVLAGTASRGLVVEVALTGLMYVVLWQRGVDVSVFRGIGVLAAVLAVYNILFGLRFPEFALFSDNVAGTPTLKDGIFNGTSLAGVFDHPNSLGMTMALTFPFVSVLPRAAAKIAAGVPIVIALVWSNSRSSLLALLVSIAWLLGAKWLNGRHRMGVVRVLIGVVLLVGAVLPFVTTDPSALTGRGAIWVGSRMAWLESPVFGNGMQWYADLGQRPGTAVSATSGHNLAITVLVTGGVVYALLVALVLRRAVLAATSTVDADLGRALQGFMLAFATLSITEFIWSPIVSTQMFPAAGLVLVLTIMHRPAARVGACSKPGEESVAHARSASRRVGSNHLSRP